MKCRGGMCPWIEYSPALGPRIDFNCPCFFDPSPALQIEKDDSSTTVWLPIFFLTHPALPFLKQVQDDQEGWLQSRVICFKLQLNGFPDIKRACLEFHVTWPKIIQNLKDFSLRNDRPINYEGRGIRKVARSVAFFIPLLYNRIFLSGRNGPSATVPFDSAQGTPSAVLSLKEQPRSGLNVNSHGCEPVV